MCRFAIPCFIEHQIVYHRNNDYSARFAGACYVNASSGSDTTGDGSSSKPYATIQAGVNAISRMDQTYYNNRTSSVYVSSGTYNEKITIPNIRCTLFIEGTVIINGGLHVSQGVCIVAASSKQSLTINCTTDSDATVKVIDNGFLSFYDNNSYITLTLSASGTAHSAIYAESGGMSFSSYLAQLSLKSGSADTVVSSYTSQLTIRTTNISLTNSDGAGTAFMAHFGGILQLGYTNYSLTIPSTYTYGLFAVGGILMARSDGLTNNATNSTSALRGGIVTVS